MKIKEKAQQREQIQQQKKAECIICGKNFDIKKEGWLNNLTMNTEGICNECLRGHSKTELLDAAVGN